MTTEPGSSAGDVTIDEALAWVAEMFEEGRANVHETTPRDAIPGWDSLGQLVLMSALDERFGIRLTEGELSKLRSVRDILDILQRNGRLAGR